VHARRSHRHARQRVRLLFIHWLYAIVLIDEILMADMKIKRLRWTVEWFYANAFDTNRSQRFFSTRSSRSSFTATFPTWNCRLLTLRPTHSPHSRRYWRGTRR
jgi:hypothetical protein